MKEKPPVSDDGPKSALELAMERLRKKDKDEGVQAKPLGEEQRAAIAEARSVAEAKLAAVADPDARETLEQEYRRDRERIANDRERKIEEIRGRG